MTELIEQELEKVLQTSASDLQWQTYEEYRDSGVEWLGKVPKHWDVKKLKFVAPISTKKLLEKSKDAPYIGLENIESQTGRLLLENPVESVESAVEVFDAGNVLFNKLRPYLAKVVYVNFAGVCTTELLVFQPGNTIEAKYLFYRLLSGDFIELINSFTYGTKMPRASSEQIMNIHIPLPSLSEQRAISSFLYHETIKIDILTKKKEEIITLLQEKRAALISHAVTKGLNAEVEMKDSGVEWLGQVPQHWGVMRIRDIAESLQTGPFGSQLHSSDYSPNGIPVINPAHLKNGLIHPDWDCAVDAETHQRLIQHELHEGDIVFARRGEMGRCALVTKKEVGWLCGTGSLRMRIKASSCFPLFLNDVLSTVGTRDWLLLESVGSTMDNLNTSILSRIPIPVPPLEEQYSIASYIDQQTSKIDVLISVIRKGIEKLKEKRIALISAAVTGKIDVRGELAGEVVVGEAVAD